MDWKKLLISPETNIADAIRIIDAGSSQIALVVDQDGKLLGTVTDGDVRRAVLNNVHLHNPVQEIMSCTPKVCRDTDTRFRIKHLMDEYELNHLPVVDDKNILVGLETLRHLTTTHRIDNPVFLMAGGFGTRLRPLTETCPKPMLRIDEKPILETILERFKKNGFWKFYISLHYMPEVLKDYFGDGSQWDVEIEYVVEKEPLGTGGALGLLPDDLSDLPLIVMNGDILTHVNFEKLLTYHEENEADISVCVRKYDYQVPFGVVDSNNSIVTRIVEKPKHEFFVNAGIYVLNRQIVEIVSSNVPIDMPLLISNSLEDGAKVVSYPIYEYWLDVGRMPDFEQAQMDWEN